MKNNVGGKYLHRTRILDDLAEDRPIVKIESVAEVPPEFGTMREPLAWRINEQSREIVMRLLGITLFEFHEKYKQ